VIFGLDGKRKVQVDSKHMSERMPVVSLKRCTKRFGGILAVNQVDLDIYPGEVHGLVGENGAGKSTLMRVLAGFHPDYEGQIYIQGKPARITSPREAMGLGIALVHQELSLVPELTVAENIYLGREHRSHIPGLISRSTIEESANPVRSRGGSLTEIKGTQSEYCQATAG
jgi:ribose transport system ATP-binding protein